MRLIINILILFIPGLIYSYTGTEWIQRYNSPGNSFDIVSKMGMDSLGNVYVYGSSNDPVSFYNFSIVKYSADGNQVWFINYNGEGNRTDQINSGVTDSSGNSFITGFITDTSGANVTTTAKFDPSGKLLWMKYFEPINHGDGSGKNVTLDKAGAVIVCAALRNSAGNLDGALIKYSDDGDEIISALFSGSGNGDDIPVSIKCDNQNNIFITGTIKLSDDADIFVSKYDASLTFRWTKTFNGSSGQQDLSGSIILTEDNSVVVCGSLLNKGNGYDYFCSKINQEGHVTWNENYNGAGNNNDICSSLTKDINGNVFVTGYTNKNPDPGSEDILTIKITSSGEASLFAQFDGKGSGTDIGFDITSDNSGNLYIGGGSDRGGNHVGYALVKYDPSGNLLFEKNYNVVKESEDFIYNVLLDAKNNIYVSGISIGKGTSFDFATIKYSNTVLIHQDLNYLPDQFNLYQNYPNPFNPSTKISYSIPKPAFVKIIVYDIEGREIKMLVNEIKSPGNYYVSFEGSDFPAGVYFYRLDAEAFNMTRKMVLLK